MILKFTMRDTAGDVVAGTPTVTADGESLTPTDETDYWTVDAPLASLVVATLAGAVPLEVMMPAVDVTLLALEATSQEVLAAVGSPAGAIAWTYELGEDRDGDGIPDRLEDGSLAWPIAGVRVYATAVDNSRAAVLDSGRTNAAGAVQLLLDPDTLPSDEGGDYVYVWRVPGGRWAFENPDKEYVGD